MTRKGGRHEIKQEKSSSADIENKAAAIFIQTSNSHKTTSKSIDQNINCNDSSKENVKAQKTEPMIDNQGIKPSSMFEKDDNSDGVKVNLWSPDKGKDDFSEITHKSNKKEAPPLVNEENKNVTTTSGRRVGVKELRLAMTNSDDSTVSFLAESDSDLEQSILSQIKEFQFGFVPVQNTKKVTCCVSVSYTHLTLPTKA